VLRPDLEIVAAADSDPSLIGRDIGVAVGTQPIGVKILGSCDLVPADQSQGVAVVCTSSKLREVAPQIEALLERGWNVISTCEELGAPWAQRDLAEGIDQSAKRVGLSVLGTGVNPGFVLDTLPLVLTAACVTVNRVVVRRTLDTNQRREPLRRKAGVGLRPAQFAELAHLGRVGHVGMSQSAQLLANGLGWSLDSWNETIEPVVARSATRTPDGVVASGFVIGIRQQGDATSNGRLVITFEIEMSAGALATDEIRIEGVPSIHSVVEGGINGDVGTMAMITNAIAVLQRLQPGLLTMRDVMPLAGVGIQSSQELAPGAAIIRTAGDT
jgi:4-hydroxy-tetrahydrodipicolinate reductase